MVTMHYYLSRQNVAVKRVWLMHDTQVNDIKMHVQKEGPQDQNIRNRTQGSPMIQVCVQHLSLGDGRSEDTLPL